MDKEKEQFDFSEVEKKFIEFLKYHFQEFGRIPSVDEIAIDELKQILRQHCVPRKDWEVDLEVAKDLKLCLDCAEKKLEKALEWVNSEDDHKLMCGWVKDELRQILTGENL